MSTLADELLQDFEDSGSEPEDAQNGDLGSNDTTRPNGHASVGDMDVDAEQSGEEDEEMGGVEDSAVEPVDDADEAKAKVEKMQLRGVSDVRSVASLMQTLEPVLEVSSLRCDTPGFPIPRLGVYIICLIH
jgi:U4/U6 small nuclear ribonucleoprotein PRP31